jgi:hypothetical protein
MNSFHSLFSRRFSPRPISFSNTFQGVAIAQPSFLQEPYFIVQR